MAGAGVAVNNPFYEQQKKQSPTSIFGNPATFTAAANQQASDYDKIMSQYDTLAQTPASVAPARAINVNAPTPLHTSGNISAANVTAQNLTPQQSKYEQSADVTGSLANLSNLATTGGYSEADINNIRARNISPIRSIYANAQQNVERQKALAGGYSPNFNAVQGKMAREEADKISDVTARTNADIVQNVATNKISAASPYANAASSANAARTAADLANANIINKTNETNAANQLESGRINSTNQLEAGRINTANANDINKFNTSMAAAAAQGNAGRQTSTDQFNIQAALDSARLAAGNRQATVQGKTSLYGTTPALVNTFGNQVVQAAQLGQGQQEINNRKLGLFGNMATRLG